ncbi:THAP domain-containing protein 3 [Orycteropus afer afer]|uniref:THAP domain-containing protein 3 n=1 Tax=Orycteropus afer afer TaxID=1230840 RepID=A0A8B6ZYR6_ORYAF|nr:THAP domain-containing protein 3 [Orycteropus afer afer]
MPKSCAARQCCNRYSNTRKQLTFHRFPFSRPELLKKWVLNIGRGNFKPKQHTVICSEHFRPECFSAFGNRKNLKHNAVPTVFAFQDSVQLVKEDTDLGRVRGNASSKKRCVLPVAGVDGTGKSKDVAELQLSPRAEASGKEVLPYRPEAAETPGQLASPSGMKQPSDHSYALLDLDALKKKLFLTLKENEKLRRRLRAQRLEMRRMGRLLSTCTESQRGAAGTPSCARPKQQS